MNSERNPTISESPPQQQQAAPQPVQFIAEKVIDRLSDAEEKHIIDIQGVWPSFKSKEKLSKDELYEAFPKIAEEVRSNPSPKLLLTNFTFYPQSFTINPFIHFKFRVLLPKLDGYVKQD